MFLRRNVMREKTHASYGQRNWKVAKEYARRFK